MNNYQIKVSIIKKETKYMFFDKTTLSTTF